MDLLMIDKGNIISERGGKVEFILNKRMVFIHRLKTFQLIIKHCLQLKFTY